MTRLGANQAARLTVDLGDGDTYLTALANYATTNWLKTSGPVLDYANAMVSSPENCHLDFGGLLETTHRRTFRICCRRSRPAKLGRERLGGRNNIIPNCNNYPTSDQEVAANFVETIPPAGAGEQPQACWAICSGAAVARAMAAVCTFPRRTPAEAGVGAGATALNIPIPDAAASTELVPLRKRLGL